MNSCIWWRNRKDKNNCLYPHNFESREMHYIANWTYFDYLPFLHLDLLILSVCWTYQHTFIYKCFENFETFIYKCFVYCNKCCTREQTFVKAVVIKYKNIPSYAIFFFQNPENVVIDRKIFKAWNLLHTYNIPDNMRCSWTMWTPK